MERRLIAILAADVVGYSHLMSNDEVGTLTTLKTCETDVIEPTVKKHNGRIFKRMGDGYLVEFSSVVDCVECALAWQNLAKKMNQPLKFRIGINLGDVLSESGDVYGDGVNIAARLESIAKPGGVSISGTAYDQVRRKLPYNFLFTGEQQVKNIPDPIRVYQVELTQQISAEPPIPETKKSGNRVTLFSLLIIISGVLLIFGYYYLNVYRSDNSLVGQTAETDSDIIRESRGASIAVLPFQNFSDDPSQEYFSDGITNDIITDLSRFSNLFVIASHSVFTYKGKRVKVKEVGQELGVRYVLEGSVQRIANKVRINAQLIDANTDRNLWAKRYHFKLNDVFTVQDEITKSIVGALEVILTEGEQEREIRRYTNVVEAYDLFLRGRTYLQGTKQTHLKARKLFNQAIELDQKFAAAFAEKSFTYFSSFIMPMSRNKKLIEAAIKAAEHAVTLDDSLPLAHARLGWAYFSARRHEEAITEGKKAVTLGPNDAESHAQLGNIMNWSGKPKEGIILIKKAMRLNPSYPYYYLFYLGHSHYLLGNNEEAIQLMNRVVTRAPYFLPVRRHLAVLFQEMGMKKEARIQVKEVLKIFPGASIEDERQRCPYRWEPSLQKRFFTGLRKSGMPEGRRGEEPMMMD
jgi:adenylate cyclase